MLVVLFCFFLGQFVERCRCGFVGNALSSCLSLKFACIFCVCLFRYAKFDLIWFICLPLTNFELYINPSTMHFFCYDFCVFSCPYLTSSAKKKTLCSNGIWVSLDWNQISFGLVEWVGKISSWAPHLCYQFAENILLNVKASGKVND